MFARVGSLVTRYRWVVVVAWAIAAIAFAAFAPSLADVGSADETTFLPKEAESVEARAVLARAFPAFHVATIGTRFHSQVGDHVVAGIPPLPPMPRLPWGN